MTDDQFFLGDPNQPLRHRVFFQAAGAMPEGSPEYNEMLAGMLVMRLLDKWPTPKPDTIELDEWIDRLRHDIQPVEDYVALVADTPVKRSLSNLTEAIGQFSRGEPDGRLSRLIAYAQFLEDATQWLPAADVYATAAELIESTRSNADLLPVCFDRSAYCQRQAKQHVRAHELLSRGIEITTQQREDASKQKDEDAIARAQYWLVRMQIAMGMLSGEMLERSYEWKDAAGIYEGTIDLIKTRPLDKPQLLPCYERAAYCLRQIGEIERAADLLNDGIGVALELQDVRWSLYLRISSAIVERQKGDLPEAEYELDVIIEDAERANETEMVARAKHERGGVAYERNQDALAVELYYAAARTYTDPALVRRALLDAAVALADLGQAIGDGRHLQYARKMCLFVRHAPDDGKESRVFAGVNLIRIAALSNDQATFQQLCDELQNEPMTGRWRTHYYLFMGQGLKRFGKAGAARSAFEKAVALAEQHRVYKLLIDAEKILAANDDKPVVWMQPEQIPAIDALFADIDAARGVFAGATWN